MSHLLGGESDVFTIVEENLKRIKDKNPPLGHQYGLVIDVFKERNKLNSQNIPATAGLARILVRSLGANIKDVDWLNHPLRQHALGEAYSIWAQAAYNDAKRNKLPGIKESDWKEVANKSLELYREVASSKSNLV